MVHWIFMKYSLYVEPLDQLYHQLLMLYTHHFWHMGVWSDLSHFEPGCTLFWENILACYTFQELHLYVWHYCFSDWWIYNNYRLCKTWMCSLWHSLLSSANRLTAVDRYESGIDLLTELCKEANKCTQIKRPTIHYQTHYLTPQRPGCGSAACTDTGSVSCSILSELL